MRCKQALRWQLLMSFLLVTAKPTNSETRCDIHHASARLAASLAVKKINFEIKNILKSALPGVDVP